MGDAATPDATDLAGFDPPAPGAARLESLLRAGLQAYFAGDFAQSAAALKGVLQTAPGNAAALLTLAHAAYRLKDWNAAADAAQTLLQASPQHQDALAILASARARQGAWRDAAIRYRAFLAAQRPGPAAAGLSFALTRLGDWGDRAKRARDRLPHERQRASGRLALARALSHDRRWDEAESVIVDSIDRHPSDGQALTLLLKAAIQADRPEKSLTLWVELARIDPQGVIRWIRILVRQGRFAWAAYALMGLRAARGSTSEILAEQSRLAGVLTRQAEHGRSLGDAGLTARALRALALLPPLHPAERTGDRAAAVPLADDKALRRDPILAGLLRDDAADAKPPAPPKMSAARTAPRPPPAWTDALTQIDGLLGRGAYDQAGEIAADAVARFPDAAPVRQALRRVLHARIEAARDAMREARFPDVVTLLAKAEIVESDRQEADALLARALMSMGRFQDSLDHWRRVVERAPDDAKAWTYIARCCKSLGFRAEGREAALRKLDLDPDDAKTRKLLEEFERQIAR